MKTNTLQSMNTDSSLQAFLKSEGISYVNDFPLAKLSFMKVGGVARHLLYPDSEQKLVTIVKQLKLIGKPYLIIGHLSNTIFRDGLIHTVVISTSCLTRQGFAENGEFHAETGCKLPEIAKYLSQAGFKGFSGLLGVPASIGGAVYMNASCFGNVISEHLVRVRCIDHSGNITEFQKENLFFSWRHSAFHNRLKGYVILSAYFAPVQGNQAEISAHLEEAKQIRNTCQEQRFPNLGSIFATKDIYSTIARRFWPYRIGFTAIRLWVKVQRNDRAKKAARIYNKYTQIYFRLLPTEHVGFSEHTFNCIINRGGANATEMISFIRTVEKTICHCVPLEIEIFEDII